MLSSSRREEWTGRKTTRKRDNAEFKAQVAMEVSRGELTLAELAAKHGIRHRMLGAWKRRAVEGMASLFDGDDQTAKAASAAEIEKLHAKIGPLLVEREAKISAAIFLRRPPVDERGTGAITDRTNAPAPVDSCAVPPAVRQPVMRRGLLYLVAIMALRQAQEGEPQDAGLAAVEHDGCGVLCRGTGSPITTSIDPISALPGKPWARHMGKSALQIMGACPHDLITPIAA